MLPEDDNLLDNQDLCLLFKVSIKTLQRYRAIGALPYFTISGKVYYKASEIVSFACPAWVCPVRQWLPCQGSWQSRQALTERLNYQPATYRFYK